MYTLAHHYSGPIASGSQSTCESSEKREDHASVRAVVLVVRVVFVS